MLIWILNWQRTMQPYSTNPYILLPLINCWNLKSQNCKQSFCENNNAVSHYYYYLGLNWICVRAAAYLFTVLWSVGRALGGSWDFFALVFLSEDCTHFGLGLILHACMHTYTCWIRRLFIVQSICQNRTITRINYFSIGIHHDKLCSSSAAEELKFTNSKSICCIVSHGVFTYNADDKAYGTVWF